MLKIECHFLNNHPVVYMQNHDTQCSVCSVFQNVYKIYLLAKGNYYYIISFVCFQFLDSSCSLLF